MALLAPQLYHDYILPVDKQIAARFPCVAFHSYDHRYLIVLLLSTTPILAHLLLDFYPPHAIL